MSKSDLEAVFAWHWRIAGVPGLTLEREYRFAPPRKWRFDYALPRLRVAIEIEGGVYTRGRHTRAGGFIADAEKYNTAASMGWYVVRIPGVELSRDPAGQIWLVNAVIRRRMAERIRAPGLRVTLAQKRRRELARAA